MAERRLILTLSISTPLPNSGQTPDICFKHSVRVSLGLCLDRVLSLIPSACQMGGRIRVHIEHLAP